MKVFATFAVGMLLGSCVFGTSAVVLATPASAQPAPVNDLIVDFGSGGLWVRLNNDRWRKLDNQSPLAVTGFCWDDFRSGGGVLASFGPGRGLLARSVAPDGEWAGFNFNRYPAGVASASGLAMADTDGNGVCDIAAIVPGSGGSRKLLMGLNDGSGWITLATYNWIYEFAFGNFDARPHDDVALSFESTACCRGLNIRMNNFSKPNDSLLTSPFGTLAAGDIDGDGLDEIVGGALESYEPDAIQAYYDPANTFLNHAFLDLPGPNPRALDIGTLDANPIEDILAGNAEGTWAMFNNTPPFVKLDSRPASHLAIADLDNSGQNDAIASFDGQGVFVRFSPGGTFTQLRAGTVEAIVPCACD